MINRKPEEILSLETLLSNYKLNKGLIKNLEEQNDSIKRQILEHYMKDNDILKNDKGITIATYKTSIRITFQTKKFEKDHKELYDKYLDMSEIKTFLVK